MFVFGKDQTVKGQPKSPVHAQFLGVAQNGTRPCKTAMVFLCFPNDQPQSLATERRRQLSPFFVCFRGGVAATLSANSIKKVEVLDMEELGMEARTPVTGVCVCVVFVE